MVKQERVCGVGGRSLAECLIKEREENKPSSSSSSSSLL